MFPDKIETMGIFLKNSQFSRNDKITKIKKRKASKTNKRKGVIAAIIWARRYGFFRITDNPEDDEGVFFSFKDIKRAKINPYHLRRVDWSKIVFSFEINRSFSNNKHEKQQTKAHNINLVTSKVEIQ